MLIVYHHKCKIKLNILVCEDFPLHHSLILYLQKQRRTVVIDDPYQSLF